MASLMKVMIAINPQRRILSNKIIKNKWIQSAHQKYRNMSKSVVHGYFQNMKAFKIQSQF